MSFTHTSHRLIDWFFPIKLFFQWNLLRFHEFVLQAAHFQPFPLALSCAEKPCKTQAAFHLAARYAVVLERFGSSKNEEDPPPKTNMTTEKNTMFSRRYIFKWLLFGVMLVFRFVGGKAPCDFWTGSNKIHCCWASLNDMVKRKTKAPNMFRPQELRMLEQNSTNFVNPDSKQNI